MEGAGTRWLGFAILVVVLAVSPLILRSFGLPGGLEWVATGLLVASVGIAVVAYRGTRDPALLYVGTGAALLATHELLVLAVLSTAALDQDLSVGALATYGSLITRAGFAAGLLLVVPWRDRRGKPPPRPVRVAGIAIGGLLVADLFLLVAGPEDASFGGVRPGLIVVSILLAAAGLRLAIRARTAATTWFAAAAFAAAVYTLAGFSFIGTEPIFASLGVSVRGAMALCIGGFVLVGMLQTIHFERSSMRRATDRAEEVMGGRAEIASMVAHEVRGPVATIRGLAATTSGSYDRLSDDERREFVGLIEQEAARLLGVVDQTSLALKIDAGTLGIERRTHDLVPIVREAVATASLGSHPIEIDAPGAILASVDRRWLAEAIRQGVDNAARFSPEEAPIIVRLREDGPLAVIEVTDRGPGVPPARREEVFGRFARWRPPGYEDRSGSGLGLFISRGILAEHGGEASLDEAAEGGTMLRLRLRPPAKG